MKSGKFRIDYNDEFKSIFRSFYYDPPIFPKAFK